MYKTKIFNGYFSINEKTADDKFNEWIQEHQDIEIKKFAYRQSRSAHSICILYDDGKRNRRNV